MSRNINNLVAIIPEWEFNKLNIKAYRRRLGNGVIINSKDLPNSTDESFSMVIFKMGGIIMPMSEAEEYVRGRREPFMFETPKIEEEITKGNDIEEYTIENPKEVSLDDIEEEVIEEYIIDGDTQEEELLELETLEEPIKEENEVLTNKEEIEK